MTREIKFRAWIKSGFDEDIKPFMANVSVIRFEARNIETDEDDNLWDFEDIILMQFTGLKDKNGKEIYEGDIIDTTDLKIDYRKVYWKVLWGKLENMWGWIAKTENGEFELDKSVCNGKIIGNIYENPNLLR